MNWCLGKSASEGEFVRRIMREQAVVVRDTPGAGSTFFWHDPRRLVLELHCKMGQVPILGMLGQCRHRTRGCPHHGASHHWPQHEAAGPAFQEEHARCNTERSQSWLQKCVKYLVLTCAWDRLEAAQPGDCSMSPVMPTDPFQALLWLPGPGGTLECCSVSPDR